MQILISVIKRSLIKLNIIEIKVGD